MVDWSHVRSRSRVACIDRSGRRRDVVARRTVRVYFGVGDGTDCSLVVDDGHVTSLEEQGQP